MAFYSIESAKCADKPTFSETDVVFVSDFVVFGRNLVHNITLRGVKRGGGAGGRGLGGEGVASAYKSI